MALVVTSPRARGDGVSSPRSPGKDDWTVSSKISSLSYSELKAIAYRHPGLIYNPHLTEKIRLFLAMELGLQRMALDTIATLRVSPYETSDEGVTVLHLACTKGFLKIFSLLQERKADLETTNERGETPLFVAAQAGHAEIVDRLIQAGCRVNVPNVHGVTALQVAALSGHLSVVQLLLKAGVTDRSQTSAAMAHMLNKRGSSHRLIAHLLALPATKNELLHASAPADGTRLQASESAKIPEMSSNSHNARGLALTRSTSAEQGYVIRARRGSTGAAEAERSSGDKQEKKSSGKSKRLSKGASESVSPASTRQDEKDEVKGSERESSGGGSRRERKTLVQSERKGSMTNG